MKAAVWVYLCVVGAALGASEAVVEINPFERKLWGSHIDEQHRFGQAVCLVGDTFAVTAPGAPGGAVHLFSRTRQGWRPSATFQGIPEKKELFGTAALTEQRLSVLRTTRDGDRRATTEVISYRRESKTKWREEEPIKLHEAIPDSWYVWSELAANAETVLAGATIYDPSRTTETKVLFIPTRRTQNSGLQEFSLSPSGTWIASLSIAATGGVVACNYQDQPIIYLFERQQTAWRLKEQFEIKKSGSGAEFIQAVKISKNNKHLAVLTRDRARTMGKLHIAERSGDSWQWQRVAQPSGADWNGFFGASVAWHNDRLFVGTRTAADPKSAVHQYEFKARTWQPVDTIRPFDVKPRDGFGASISGANDTLLVGAPGDSDRALSAGAVYVFERLGRTSPIIELEPLELPLVVAAEIEASASMADRPLAGEANRNSAPQKLSESAIGWEIAPKGLIKGVKPFTDTPDEISALPGILNKLTLLRGPNSTSRHSIPDLQISVDEGAYLFRAVNDAVLKRWTRGRLPEWVKDFGLTSYRISVNQPSDRNLKSYAVFARQLPPGKTALAELCLPAGVDSDHFVFFGKPVELPADPVRFPLVTGKYHVGTETFHLVDNSRDELYTPSVADDKRELMVQIWYPSDPGTGDPARWLPDWDVFIPEARKAFSFIPELFWEGCKRIQCNAILRTPLSKDLDRYPVLLYAHGWEQMRQENAWLLEELASHGYIILAPDFTYNSKAVRFPDGRVVRVNRGPTGGSSPDEIHLADLRFLLSEVARPSSSGPLAKKLAGRLDLDRIGMLGFSHGGALTIQMLRQNEQLKAGVALDIRVNTAEVRQPFMLLCQPEWGKQTLDTKAARAAYLGVLKGTRHFDFSDFSLVWGLLKFPASFAPAILESDPVRLHRITADYCLAFFETHLNGNRIPLLDRTPPEDSLIEFRKLQR